MSSEIKKLPQPEFESYNTILDRMARRENRKLLYSMIFFPVALVAIVIIPFYLLNQTQDVRQHASENQIPLLPTATSIPTRTAVPDTTRPNLTIIYPTLKSNIAARSIVNIQVEANDNTSVTHVDFFVDEKLICSDTSAPYTCSWKVPAKSTPHYIQVKAFDAAGNYSTRSTFVTANN
ncbi:MAG TPA: Ig-like domain-containing protein [Patescibacteria group bacterium]|nr:Ig-like domain-containing protein [Patescibacteria group bacterium]